MARYGKLRLINTTIRYQTLLLWSLVVCRQFLQLVQHLVSFNHSPTQHGKMNIDEATVLLIVLFDCTSYDDSISAPQINLCVRPYCLQYSHCVHVIRIRSTSKVNLKSLLQGSRKRQALWGIVWTPIFSNCIFSCWCCFGSNYVSQFPSQMSFSKHL